MYELKKIYLQVNLLEPGPCLMKKNLPGHGLTKVEKHCSRERQQYGGHKNIFFFCSSFHFLV